MVTREFLQKEGFKQSTYSSESVEQYEKEIGYRKYICVRFHPTNSKYATGLYAYSQFSDNLNTRKVVLNETNVTEEDLQMALKICGL